MKHLCIILASVFTFHLFAAPMATVDWVKAYVAEHLAKTDSATTESSVAPLPETLNKTFSGDMIVDGITYEVSLGLKSSSSLSLIVTESNVSGIKVGTVYAWNGAMSAFECENPVLPIINADTFAAGRAVTNLAGEVSIATNTMTHYRAAHSDGRKFFSATYYGRDYLVTSAGFSGPKIGYVVSYAQESGVRIQGSVLKPNPFVPTPFLSAYADDAAGVAAAGGAIELGEVTIRRKGREEKYTINRSWYFNSGVGSGTVAEYTARAFSDWYANPKGGIYVERRNNLVNRLLDYTAWGMGEANDVLELGDDQLEIRYNDLYTKCQAFTDAMNAAQEYLGGEYVRIFLILYNKLKTHDCPSLLPGEECWTLEMGCKCRHTYPDLTTGEDIPCRMADTPNHDFKLYKLSGSSLVISEDDAGCLICSRCLEYREHHGANHMEVPESADYCGCYCGYYYEKKESEESTEPEGSETQLPGGIYGGVEVIDKTTEKDKEEVEIECTGPDGETTTVSTTVEVTRYHIATNRVDAKDVVAWRHVSKTVIGANGKRIKVTTSANSLMEGKIGSVMHHKPQHPMECTCKCGVEHFFKASPCPEICRGCKMARDCFRDTDGGEVWAGHTNGTNLNINVRGYHVKLEDGYWDDEAFTLKSDDGTSTDYIWNNKTGGAFYTSPYADWYFSVTTNGYAACGCACGRFYSDSTGNHGKAGRDRDGNEVDSGHHGNFHVYGLKKASDIKCPFTAYFYADDPQAVFPSCACNNRSWEEANPPSSVGGSILDEHGWIGAFSKGKNSGSESLACEGACRWCWPYGHGAFTDTELKISHHTGVGRAGEVLEDDVYRAYVGWIDSVGGLECGCLCQALKESTSAGSDGEYAFAEKWSEVVSENFHFCSWENDCLCDCGRLHFALTPETWAKYNPFTAAPAFSRCSREMGICQICGYYDKTAVKENLNRADPTSHAFGAGCGCDCASDGGIARFKTEGYSRAVRGWSAAQDGDNYPNNTRSASRGYKYRDDDIFERYHAGNNGHLCACHNTVGYHLYHKQDEGENCPDVCKARINGLECGHKAEYYTYNTASKTYTDADGEHTRSNDADYCGCDCGGEISHMVSGKSAPWHVAADGECYCYGHYAPGSPNDHNGGVPVLIAHVNLQPTGNVVSNSVDCANEFCDLGWWEVANEFKCQNGHIIYGKPREVGRECSHDEKKCPRNCDCCDATNSKGCECPYCHFIEAADKCTCKGRTADKGTFKITNPVLTAEDFAELFAAIDRDEVVEIDGDDPVYEIGLAALAGECCNMPMLETVKFNFVTNVGESAFEGAFKNCPNLKSVEFARLRIIGIGAFQYAFQECPSLKALHLPKVERIDYLSFKNCGIQEISCPSAGIIIFEAFVDSNLTTADFAAAVTVEDRAFHNCKSLSRINLPSVSYLGPECFAGCTALKTIVLPQYNFLGSMVQTRMFAGSSLTDIYLPAMSINDWNARDEIVFDKTGETSVDFGIPSGCRLHFSDGTATVQ